MYKYLIYILSSFCFALLLVAGVVIFNDNQTDTQIFKGAVLQQNALVKLNEAQLMDYRYRYYKYNGIAKWDITYKDETGAPVRERVLIVDQGEGVTPDDVRW